MSPRELRWRQRVARAALRLGRALVNVADRVLPSPSPTVKRVPPSPRMPLAAQEVAAQIEAMGGAFLQADTRWLQLLSHMVEIELGCRAQEFANVEIGLADGSWS